MNYLDILKNQIRRAKIGKANEKYAAEELTRNNKFCWQTPGCREQMQKHYRNADRYDNFLKTRQEDEAFLNDAIGRGYVDVENLEGVRSLNDLKY